MKEKSKAIKPKAVGAKNLTPKRTKTLDLELNVLDSHGKKAGSLKLDKDIFDGRVSRELIKQAVVTYLANQRKGLAKTKTRGDVRGGGRKPWRQKGTGRARFGSSRNPVWRGGGVAFGPVPHSFRKDFPRKMSLLALKSALNAKALDSEIIILSELALKSHKTKDFVKVIKNLKLTSQKVNFVVGAIDDKLKLAARNIDKVLLCRAQDIHTIEVVNCKRIVLTKEAMGVLVGRIKKTSHKKK